MTHTPKSTPSETWRAYLQDKCAHAYGMSRHLAPNQCTECRASAGEPPRRSSNPLTLTDEQREEYRTVAAWGRDLVRDTLRRHYRDDHSGCDPH